jgi:hypothetical protein
MSIRKAFYNTGKKRLLAISSNVYASTPSGGLRPSWPGVSRPQLEGERD